MKKITARPLRLATHTVRALTADYVGRAAGASLTYVMLTGGLSIATRGSTPPATQPIVCALPPTLICG